MKKILSLILSFTILFTLSVSLSAFASETTGDEEYQEYLKLIQQGVLENTISFNDWQALKNQSLQLEKKLESSTAFSNIYDSTKASSYSM